MARTPTVKPAVDTGAELVDMGQLNKDAEQAQALGKIEQAYNSERDLANQLYGRRQMASGLVKLLTVSSLIELQTIKDSKLFKHLTNPESANSEHFSTWEEFCEVCVGESRQSVDGKLLDLKTFGEDAIESMNNIGLGVRQIRQLRKLPSDEIEQAKVLAKENDKDSLLDLIEDQAVKHSKEKEALEEKLKIANEEKEATDKIIEQKDKKINELDRDAQRRAIMEGNTLHRELEEDLYKDLMTIQADVRVLAKSIENITFKGTMLPETLRGRPYQALELIRAQLRDIEVEHDVVKIETDEDDFGSDGELAWGQEFLKDGGNATKEED